MLQLPANADSPAASRPRSGRPVVTEIDCPALRLLVEYDNLIQERNAITGSDEKSAAGRRRVEKIKSRMDKITERAAGISPESYHGAVFQLMLAWGEVNTIANGASQTVRDNADDLFTRLMYRAFERLAGDFEFPPVRQYFCPPDCDPRKFGAR